MLLADSLRRSHTEGHLVEYLSRRAMPAPLFFLCRFLAVRAGLGQVVAWGRALKGGLDHGIDDMNWASIAVLATGTATSFPGSAPLGPPPADTPNKRQPGAQRRQ